MNFDPQFMEQMQHAAQLLQKEGPMAATAAIQRALHGGAMPGAMPAGPAHDKADVLIDINPPGVAGSAGRPQGSGLAGLAQRLRAAASRPAVQDVESSDATPQKGKFLSLSGKAPA